MGSPLARRVYILLWYTDPMRTDILEREGEIRAWIALEYLGTDYPKSHTAKLKLIEDGIKEHRCEKCGRVEWMESKIPLELHHRNGNHHDWNLENLEILCPNCHAQEPNNSGAARKVMPR